MSPEFITVNIFRKIQLIISFHKSFIIMTLINWILCIFFRNKLLIQSNKTPNQHFWRCLYRRCDAPPCDIIFLLHCSRLNRKTVPFLEWYVPMLENDQISSCTLSKFSLSKHFSLQTELFLIFSKFWAVAKEYSISLIPGWACAFCFAAALSRNTIYPHHFLIHSFHAQKADF